MRKGYQFVGVRILAIMALVALCTSQGNAQCTSLAKKYLPTLSLQKWQPANAPGGDVTNTDTICVAEPAPGEQRYLSVPIFVKQCLDPNNDIALSLTGEPIYSFRFKMQYNTTLMRAVGVSKRGSLPSDNFVLAKDFNMSWDTALDDSYKLSTTGSASANGGRIMVTGSSSIPLPLSPLKSGSPVSTCQFRDTTVLIYVLFEVVGDAQGGSSGANTDLLILTLDSLRWNNYEPNNVTQAMRDDCFENFQAGVTPVRVIPITYPNTYGASVVRITRRPRIDLQPTSQVVLVNAGDPASYRMLFPLQTQYGNNNYIWRNLVLDNGIAGTKLRNLRVQTDASWLRVNIDEPAGGVGAGGAGPDRGILIRQTEGPVNFNVIANPQLLPSVDGSGYPTPGLYKGYITISSYDALNSAVRLEVTLIVNRNPLEPALNADQESVQTKGIRLLFRNSSLNPDTTYLTFGTGIGASENVDTVFGENQATTPPQLNRFYARFYPPTLDNGSFNGLIDTRGLYTTVGRVPFSTTDEASIDIRNFNADSTLLYCVRFSAGDPQDYPVVVEYDINDFPIGSQLFIRENVVGTQQVTNMRQATNLGGNRRAFFIRDPNVRSFCIEYTLPSIFQFPEINRGWNFVSLPVIPSDPRSAIVFPNASSVKPIRFTQNQYVADDTVRIGAGYFVKYGNVIDRTVPGVPVRQITRADNIRLYEGWNTVGALYVPTTTDPTYMNFEELSVGAGDPVRIGEVYRYLTNRGYEQTARIIPGYGYWVNVSKDGYYQLSAPPSAFKFAPEVNNQAYKSMTRLTINDNSQKIGTLYFGQNAKVDDSRYELPPVPASGMFDVRFNNGGFVSATNDAISEHVFDIQGVEYPLVLSAENVSGSYTVADAVTGEVFGTFNRGENNTVIITNPLTKSVKLISSATAATQLGAAYPNPASDKMSFDFTVTDDQFVTVILTDALGKEVARLYEGEANGHQVVEVSTRTLASGIYYYTMKTSAGYTEVRQVVISK